MSNERTRNLLRPEKNSLLLKYVNPGHYEIEVIFIDGIFSQFDASAYSVECAMITFDSWVHEPSMSNSGWIQLCFILSQSLLHGDIYSLRVRIPPAQKSRSCLLRLSKRATNHCCFQQQTNNKGHEVLGEQNTIMVNFWITAVRDGSLLQEEVVYHLFITWVVKTCTFIKLFMS